MILSEALIVTGEKGILIRNHKEALIAENLYNVSSFTPYFWHRVKNLTSSRCFILTKRKSVLKNGNLSCKEISLGDIKILYKGIELSDLGEHMHNGYIGELLPNSESLETYSNQCVISNVNYSKALDILESGDYPFIFNTEFNTEVVGIEKKGVIFAL